MIIMFFNSTKFLHNCFMLRLMAAFSLGMQLTKTSFNEMSLGHIYLPIHYLI